MFTVHGSQVIRLLFTSNTYYRQFCLCKAWFTGWTSINKMNSLSRQTYFAYVGSYLDRAFIFVKGFIKGCARGVFALLFISGIQGVKLCSSPLWTCWQTLLQRLDPPGSGKTWWQRAGARRVSQGAVAAERLRRVTGTERPASRNPPADDTVALIAAHGPRRPEGGQTHDFQCADEVKSATGGVQLCAIKDTWWSVVWEHVVMPTKHFSN